MGRRAIGAVTVFCVACLIVNSFASAQPQGSGTLEQLLQEVRGLRSELNHASAASIRTQLLVARLQLQEQRINNMARELTQVQTELAAITDERDQMRSALKRLEDLQATMLSADERRSLESEATAIKSQLEHRTRHHQELLQREAALANAVAAEQARWADFNSRLDELERSLAAPAGR